MRLGGLAALARWHAGRLLSSCCVGTRTCGASYQPHAVLYRYEASPARFSRDRTCVRRAATSADCYCVNRALSKGAQVSGYSRSSILPIRGLKDRERKEDRTAFSYVCNCAGSVRVRSILEACVSDTVHGDFRRERSEGSEKRNELVTNKRRSLVERICPVCSLVSACVRVCTCECRVRSRGVCGADKTILRVGSLRMWYCVENGGQR